MIMQLLALVGGTCFAYCGVPAAIASFKAKAPAAPLSVTVPIVVGGICMYTYLLGTYGFNLILALNYGVEVMSWGLILYYHVKRRSALGEKEIAIYEREGDGR